MLAAVFTVVFIVILCVTLFFVFSSAFRDLEKKIYEAQKRNDDPQEVNRLIRLYNARLSIFPSSLVGKITHREKMKTL